MAPGSELLLQQSPAPGGFTADPLVQSASSSLLHPGSFCCCCFLMITVSLVKVQTLTQPRDTVAAAFNKTKTFFSIWKTKVKRWKGERGGELKGFFFPAGGSEWNKREKYEKDEKQRLDDAAGRMRALPRGCANPCSVVCFHLVWDTTQGSRNKMWKKFFVSCSLKIREKQQEATEVGGNLSFALWLDCFPKWEWWRQSGSTPQCGQNHQHPHQQDEEDEDQCVTVLKAAGLHH